MHDVPIKHHQRAWPRSSAELKSVGWWSILNTELSDSLQSGYLQPNQSLRRKCYGAPQSQITKRSHPAMAFVFCVTHVVCLVRETCAHKYYKVISYLSVAAILGISVFGVFSFVDKCSSCGLDNCTLAMSQSQTF